MAGFVILLMKEIIVLGEIKENKEVFFFSPLSPRILYQEAGFEDMSRRKRYFSCHVYAHICLHLHAIK